jgi:hypothetical protein
MLTLTPAELRELTGYSRRSEQARVLAEQSIPFKEIGGRLVVLSCHVVAWMENRPVRQEVGIDFTAVR